MHFTKMNGAGNDFVILDAVEQPLGLAPEDAVSYTHLTLPTKA